MEELKFLGRAAGGAQPHNVALHLRLFPQMLHGLAQDSGRDFVHRRRDSVVHPFAFAPCRHDARPAQVGQVARDFRLAHSQDFYKIANTDFTVANQVQQPQPCRIRKRAKQHVEGEAW